MKHIFRRPATSEDCQGEECTLVDATKGGGGITSENKRRKENSSENWKKPNAGGEGAGGIIEGGEPVLNRSEEEMEPKLIDLSSKNKKKTSPSGRQCGGPRLR